MRLGVLDVGSNTVHLLVVDAHPGARPLPARSIKVELRLAEMLEPDGSIGTKGADRLVRFLRDAMREAEDQGVEEVLAFATSALREARNGEWLLERVRETTGVELSVLTGEDEARLTFLAVRRWFGWSSGRLLVLDIGGGSLEIANGVDEYPDVAVSIPLGAGRLTREWFGDGGVPKPKRVRELRRHVRVEIGRVVGQVQRMGDPDRVVATSKTFRSLARICGAAPSGEGIYVRRSLRHVDLEQWLPKIAEMPPAERAALPGVSHGRSSQLLAGALVADAAMDLFRVDQLDICPWALREGLILRRLDALLDTRLDVPFDAGAEARIEAAAAPATERPA